MCGRYSLSRTEEIRERFLVEPNGFEFQPKYNICPEQIVPAIVQEDIRRLVPMKWGLIPSWFKEPKSVAINVRLEGILRKASFRNAIRSQRCLIPATGFYEWKKSPEGKTPYNICRKDGGLFAFAGIYDAWKDPDGAELKTFAILTTAPNGLMAQVHNRMPIILKAEQEDFWLRATAEEVSDSLEHLEGLQQDQMNLYAVSRNVNFARNDTPDLIAPCAQEDMQNPADQFQAKLF